MDQKTVAKHAPRPRYLLLSCLCCLWLVALIPGIRYLVAFEDTAGRQGRSPSDWSSTSLASGDAHLPTLLVVLHPKCSCSNATLTELEEAAQEFQTPYNAILLIDLPGDINFDWHQTASYWEAQKALQATVILDSDGKIAAGFGAFTSGDVLLYSAEDAHSRRSLLFSGGVTGARGMVGANTGVEALEAAFKNPRQKLHAPFPVFGCGLFHSSSSADEGMKD